MKLEQIKAAQAMADKLVQLRQLLAARKLIVIKVSFKEFDDFRDANTKACEAYFSPSNTAWKTLLETEINDLEFKLEKLGVDVS